MTAPRGCMRRQPRSSPVQRGTRRRLASAPREGTRSPSRLSMCAAITQRTPSARRTSRRQAYRRTTGGTICCSATPPRRRTRLSCHRPASAQSPEDGAVSILGVCPVGILNSDSIHDCLVSVVRCVHCESGEEQMFQVQRDRIRTLGVLVLYTLNIGCK